MKTPIRVAVTGAAGNVGYSLVFRIANGDLFGAEQPVILQMLEIPPAMKALEGVAMELSDCAFPLLADMVLADDANVAFKDVNWALLVGARPRGKGMERKDLLTANASIFVAQGKALNAAVAADVRVVVVGNPANTNCLVAMSNARDIPRERFTSMTRLDQNRAAIQLAQKAGVSVREVKKVTIWGNHSSTQYPDAIHAEINGKSAPQMVGGEAWIKETFIPAVQQRGAAVIEARGQSSAGSAANAIVNHVQDWYRGTTAGNWASMGLLSTGTYGAPTGVVFSYPVTVKNGVCAIVEGLELDAFARERLAVTSNELLQEREMVLPMLGQ